MPVIDVKHLTKTYKTYKRGAGMGQTFKSFFQREEVVVNAVNDISFAIGQGEICGILGPNGAGKSTAIKMLCGALFPTSGEIQVLGYSPARDRKRYVGKIGAVFGQKSQLIWDIPPIDSFNMNKAIYGIANQDFKHRLEELTGMLDIAHVIEKPTRVLSLGERMKCEFVMAMLHRPEVLFLDEPTIGLDVIAKVKIREFIHQMNKKHNMTCILTTHDLEDVEELAHRVIVINHGEKVFDESLQQLKLFLGIRNGSVLLLRSPCTKPSSTMPTPKWSSARQTFKLRLKWIRHLFQSAILSKKSPGSAGSPTFRSRNCRSSRLS